jgi:Schlafen, AlbA_2
VTPLVPRFIRSLIEFNSLIHIGTTPESEVLEFKSEIDNWNPPNGVEHRDRLKKKAQKETCRDIAQFANTLGGCLLVGVAEQAGANGGPPVASAIVPAAPELRQWIEDAITNFLAPATITHDIAPIMHSSGLVLAVNIPPSIHLVVLRQICTGDAATEQRELKARLCNERADVWDPLVCAVDGLQLGAKE